MPPVLLSLWFLSNSPEPINPLPAVFTTVPDQWFMRHWSWTSNQNETAESINFFSSGFLSRPSHVVAEGNTFDVFDVLRADGDQLKRKTKITSDWATVSGQFSVRHPDAVRDDPLRRGHSWATDETVKVPVGESLFVFSAIDGENDAAEQRQMRWLGRTGVGVRLRPWFLNEVQLRGGPGMRYDETDRPARGSPERSELFVEVTTKVPLPLLGLINVEYVGTSIQGVNAQERDQVRQNLRFALPLSDGGSQFHVGARWWSEDTPTPTPFIDRAQLFLGIQIKR